MKKLFLICFLVIPLLFSCAAHTNIEPTGRGNYQGSLNFGGPIVSAFNTKVPIPYFSAGLDYGLNEELDINGNFHILPLFYEFAGAEVGASYYPIINDGYIPTLGLGGRLLCFSSFKSDVEERFQLFQGFMNFTAGPEGITQAG